MASIDENKNNHRKITMTHTQTTYINRITLRAGKNGARPAEFGALASATELKQQKLLKCKQTIQIVTFNVRTLNRIGQLPVLTASAVEHKIDIICIQEHRYTLTKDIKYHETGNGLTLISDVLLWTPTYGRAKIGRPARTYIQQLCEDTECISEDLPEAMNDRKKWRERVRDIYDSGTTWWWWWWCWHRFHYCLYPVKLGCVGIVVKFILVSLFTSILTFVGDLIPKPSFKKNSSGAVQPKAGRIRGFILFPRVFV